MIRHINLELNGIVVAADFYLPDLKALPCPAVVMAPGFGGVKEMLIPFYAQALQQAGIATLAVDYPHFGGSGGTPRQYIDIKAHHATYTRALDFLQTDEHIDARKLAVWGSSLSGGHALVIAARDRRVQSAFVIIPFIATSLQMAPRFATVTVRDWVARKLGGGGSMIKIAGRPGEFAAMNSDGAWEWMQQMTANTPGFVNEVTVSSLLQMASYRTARAAKSIRVPLKVVLATDDTITPARMVKNALASLPDVVFEEYPETHFELFDQYLNATVESTVAWFQKTLSAPDYAAKKSAHPQTVA